MQKTDIRITWSIIFQYYKPQKTLIEYTSTKQHSASSSENSSIQSNTEADLTKKHVCYVFFSFLS